MTSTKLVLTCEHGGNNIPAAYASYFKDAEDDLQSYSGYDAGALDLFRYLEVMSDYSNFSITSRLLVELNRSLHHPKVFSEYTRFLSKSVHEEILKEHYTPYRTEVTNAIEKLINKGNKILHVSVHTFEPMLNDEHRKAHIGLLYDPVKPDEKDFCFRWKEKLNTIVPYLKIRFNYPNLGNADSFISHLRKKFPEKYMGIVLEVNQRYVENDYMDSRIKHAITDSLEFLLSEK